MQLQYSSGILIRGRRRKGNNSAALDVAKAQEFIDSTKDWLDTLKRLGTGARLLQEIDDSGHVVEIYRTWEITDGNHQGGDDPALAMVVPLTTKHPDGTTELHQVLSRASEDLSGRSSFKLFFGIGRARPRFLPRDAIARLVGVTPSNLTEMEKGRRPIPPAVDVRLRSYLYHFLTPGDGWLATWCSTTCGQPQP